MEIKVIHGSETPLFLEGDGVCPEYVRTDKITFGSSTLGLFGRA